MLHQTRYFIFLTSFFCTFLLVGCGINPVTGRSEVQLVTTENEITMGKENYVDDEKYIDMATAVSGSGPAYVFLFMECLVEAAVGIGLSRDMAKQLVIETVIGSGNFAEKSDKTLEELRIMVTSPGGTTAAALLKLEEGKFSELIMQAVKAAHDRAIELGG